MSGIKALDKLCELVNESNGYVHADAIRFADEIEAEAAEMKSFCERVERAAKAREELEVFGTAYMPLPLDADGVPIHMGDAVEGELFYDNATVRGTVCAYHIHDDDEPGTVYIRVKPTKDTWTIKELRFERCRHVKPRTLEDVLFEFGEEFEGEMDEIMPIIVKYAEEIRELIGVGR